MNKKLIIRGVIAIIAYLAILASMSVFRPDGSTAVLAYGMVCSLIIGIFTGWFFCFMYYDDKITRNGGGK